MTEKVTAMATETKAENVVDQKPVIASASIEDETLPIGMRLRAQREALGLTIEDIAGSLKIPVRKVKAIEAEQWEALPTGPYLKGFLRSYAKVLRIDAQHLIKQIDSSLTQSRSPDTILRMPQSFETPLPRPPIDPSDSKLGRRMIYLGLALLILIGVIVWSGTQSFSDLLTRVEAPFVKEVPQPVQSQAETVPASQPAAVIDSTKAEGSETISTTLESLIAQTPVANAIPGNVGADPAKTVSVSSVATLPQTIPAAAVTLKENPIAPAPDGVPLVLNFSADTWVEIKQADGKILMSRVNPANTSVPLVVVPPASVIIGNATAVKMQYRNESFDLSPHVQDNVARLTLK